MNSPIPVKAGTYGFTPEILRDHVEGDLFVLRHGTRKDEHDRQFLIQAAGLIGYSEAQKRQAIIEELREGWTSDNMAHNITRLEAYWDAIDEFREAIDHYQKQVRDLRADVAEGEEIKLPDPPVLDFEPREAKQLETLLAEVQSHSRRVALIAAMNGRWLTQLPRITLRIILKSTTLDVSPARAGGFISEDGCEDVLDALDRFARQHGDEDGTAVVQLLAEAQRAFRLTEDEVKNSSSPGSGNTARKPSAEQSTSKGADQSKRTKTSAKATG